ncbi:MAG TPA: matrixin family metalloprotease [Actinomycetota bacterium]
MRGRLARSVAVVIMLGGALVAVGGGTEQVPKRYLFQDRSELVPSEPSSLGTAACADPAGTLHPWTVPITPNDASEKYYIDVSGAPSDLSGEDVKFDVQSGFASWNNEYNDCGRSDSSNFVFASLGATTRYPSLFEEGSGSDNCPEQPNEGMRLDGYNDVAFISLDGPGGTLAEVRVCAEFNPSGRDRVLEWDIAFDSAEDWQTTISPSAGVIDIYNVATHEAGHVVGVAHVSGDPDSCVSLNPQSVHKYLTMFRCSWPEAIVHRTLGLGDMLKLEYIVGVRPCDDPAEC